jgi:hypothetical protein
MNTNTRPPARLPGLEAVAYNIQISERQRYYLHLGLQALLREQFEGGPAYNETDALGGNIVCSLEDMLNPEGTTGPLCPTPGHNQLCL